MIRAVLDTNVLASGFAGYPRRDSTPVELIRRWRAAQFVLVISEHIFAELTRTFTDRYFTRKLSAAEIAAAISMLRIDAVNQQITLHVAGIASQAKDDLILATAVSAQVDYLVTGDRKLQALGSYRDSLLVSPRQFLAILDSSRGLE